MNAREVREQSALSVTTSLGVVAGAVCRCDRAPEPEKVMSLGNFVQMNADSKPCQVCSTYGHLFLRPVCSWLCCRDCMMPTQDLCVRCWFYHLRQLEAWSLGRKKLQLASATLKVRAPARHVLKQLEGRLSLGRKTELGKVLPLPWKGSSVARHTPLKMDLWLCDICNWTFEQVYRCWCGRWVCWGCWHLRWN